MADYSVTFARSARKELEKLPSSVARRVIEPLFVVIGYSPRPPVDGLAVARRIRPLADRLLGGSRSAGAFI